MLLIDKTFAMMKCKDTCKDGTPPVVVKGVCWTLQYNSFDVTFDFDQDLGAPLKTKTAKGKDKPKIDMEHDNACIQFFKSGESTAITPSYNAKFYKQNEGNYEVYINWRDLRPGGREKGGDLNVIPLALFQGKTTRSGKTAEASFDTPSKDALLSFSRKSKLNEDGEYQFTDDISEDGTAREILRPKKIEEKTWNKGVFLSVYEAVFPEGEGATEQGNCKKYVAPRKVAGATFQNTYCVFFDLHISRKEVKGKDGIDFCIDCVLVEDARKQQELKTEHCEAHRDKKERKDKKERTAKEGTKTGDGETVEGDGKKRKETTKERKGRTKEKEAPQSLSSESVIDILFKNLRTSYTDLNDDNKKLPSDFTSLNLEYKPREAYTVNIEEDASHSIWGEIKQKLNELEKTEYAQDLKEVLGGKEIYELEPKKAAYKHALDALLSLWLYQNTEKNLRKEAVPSEEPPLPPPVHPPQSLNEAEEEAGEKPKRRKWKKAAPSPPSRQENETASNPKRLPRQVQASKSQSRQENETASKPKRLPRQVQASKTPPRRPHTRSQSQKL
jgi:hypothetical protein